MVMDLNRERTNQQLPDRIMLCLHIRIDLLLSEELEIEEKICSEFTNGVFLTEDFYCGSMIARFKGY